MQGQVWVRPPNTSRSGACRSAGRATVRGQIKKQGRQLFSGRISGRASGAWNGWWWSTVRKGGIAGGQQAAPPWRTCRICSPFMICSTVTSRVYGRSGSSLGVSRKHCGVPSLQGQPTGTAAEGPAGCYQHGPRGRRLACAHGGWKTGRHSRGGGWRLPPAARTCRRRRPTA